MDGVKHHPKRPVLDPHPEPVEGIALKELERVMGLRLDVHANHLKACAVVPHRSPTGTTE
jgi:hypothetical protein